MFSVWTMRTEDGVEEWRRIIESSNWNRYLYISIYLQHCSEQAKGKKNPNIHPQVKG